MMNANNLFDYAGCIHVHSSYSFDGRTPVQEILKAANRCGLDFIMLTDHDVIQARDDGLEGWHNGTLLIVGQEIAPRFNHYLAFQLEKAIPVEEEDTNIDPQGYIDRVKGAGGIGFIAHPDHEGSELFHVKHYPWLQWKVTGFDGVGIWDFMTDWQMALTGYAKALYAYLFPAMVLKGPRPVTLQRWDHLNRDRKIIGIGELDNHNTVKRISKLSVPVFPFSRAFRTIRTHILTDSPLKGGNVSDISTMISALSKGRVYISLDSFKPARGFSFTVEDEQCRSHMGDTFDLKGNATLRVTLPYKALIRLVKNGVTWQEEIKKDIEIAVMEPGIYRAESWLKIMGKIRPWIFSNPIYVR
ncbi:MAG: CehA/McbA family metallohydrolase [Syntrophales bacterium]|jgi:hypothetical protein